MIPKKPNWFWAIGGMLLLASVVFVSNGSWVQNQYYIYIGGFVLWVMSSGSGERQKILPEEAERIALNEICRRRRRGDSRIPDGGFKVIPEMKISEEGNVLTGREVGIEFQNDERKVVVVTVPIFKELDGSVDLHKVTLKDDWSTEDSPNVRILKPDDTLEFIRMNEDIRRRLAEKAGAS